jgi:hypothetical protein
MLSFLTLLLARTPAMAGSGAIDVSEIIAGEAASKCLEDVEWLKL